MRELKDVLKEYREFTRTTAIYPGEKGLLYCTLGLQNEVGELIDKMMNHNESLQQEFSGEAGDILWYITRLADELGINIEDIVPDIFDTKIGKSQFVMLVFRLEENIGDLYGLLKKSVRGDKELDKKTIEERMCAIIFTFQVILSMFDLTLRDIVKQNMEKLSSRKERGKIKGDGDHR